MELRCAELARSNWTNPIDMKMLAASRVSYTTQGWPDFKAVIQRAIEADASCSLHVDDVVDTLTQRISSVQSLPGPARATIDRFLRITSGKMPTVTVCVHCEAVLLALQNYHHLLLNHDKTLHQFCEVCRVTPFYAKS